jgi:hypothetical protein
VSQISFVTVIFVMGWGFGDERGELGEKKYPHTQCIGVKIRRFKGKMPLLKVTAG